MPYLSHDMVAHAFVHQTMREAETRSHAFYFVGRELWAGAARPMLLAIRVSPTLFLIARQPVTMSMQMHRSALMRALPPGAGFLKLDYNLEWFPREDLGSELRTALIRQPARHMPSREDCERFLKHFGLSYDSVEVKRLQRIQAENRGMLHRARHPARLPGPFGRDYSGL